jgi:hypothetical protein
MLGCVTQRTQLLASVANLLAIVACVIDAIVEVLANIPLVGRGIWCGSEDIRATEVDACLCQ